MKNLKFENDINELIQDFLPTINYWASYYTPKSSAIISKQDLVVLGMIGLVDAVKKYDDQKKNKFKTYAEFRIRGEMIDELRRIDWLSRGDRKKVKQVDQEVNKLTQSLGRYPTSSEVDNVIPFTKKDTNRIKIINGGKHLHYDDNLVSSQDESLEQKSLKKSEWSYILSKLNYNMRRVIELKYFEDNSFSEIGKILKLTEGRISQLHTEAIKILKNELGEDDRELLAS